MSGSITGHSGASHGLLWTVRGTLDNYGVIIAYETKAFGFGEQNLQSRLYDWHNYQHTYAAEAQAVIQPHQCWGLEKALRY